MPKTIARRAEEVQAGDYKRVILGDREVSVLLKINAEQNAWVEAVANTTDVAKPKVFLFLLERAMAQTPESYAVSLRKALLESRKRTLDEQIAELEQQRKAIAEHIAE